MKVYVQDEECGQTFPAVKHSLPVGCMAMAEIPALCLYRVFSTLEIFSGSRPPKWGETMM